MKPVPGTWRFYTDTAKKEYITIKRLQFPLMPATTMNLYSLQGTTGDPGLVAYWQMPARASKTIEMLIVYVMLSRPRPLQALKPVGPRERARPWLAKFPFRRRGATSSHFLSNFVRRAAFSSTSTGGAPAARGWTVLRPPPLRPPRSREVS